ncbi:unnamed protein product [marine sediment metagenome]|uniref:Uncharacterized protein n=1 Tax=marine sediment metagenome TaxID=412755 RepID=X0ZYP4_9ZZZZ
MRDETTVVITMEGVRRERLPRLRTTVKTYLHTLAREVNVDSGENDGEQAIREVPEQGATEQDGWPWKRKRRSD